MNFNYKGYVTETLEKMKKNLWAKYIFGGHKKEDLEWFYAICEELARRKDDKKTIDKSG